MVYSEQFYRTQVAGALRSAKKILPLIFEIFKPKSIIDVGCRTGAC